MKKSSKTRKKRAKKGPGPRVPGLENKKGKHVKNTWKWVGQIHREGLRWTLKGVKNRKKVTEKG